MLAAIESLLSAVVADNMSGDRHKPDAELLAQGVANRDRADVRRHPGHRRDRPHGDQYPLGRHVARRRNRACTHAAGDRAGRRAAGAITSRCRRWPRF